MFEESGKPRLIINGLEIENFKEVGGIGSDEGSVAYDIPDFLMIDKKNATKWIGDIDSDDAEAIQNLFGLDTDLMIGKKIRVILQVLGPAKRER